jgi:type IX secretion system PorP/SprF family membrane protein
MVKYLLCIVLGLGLISQMNTIRAQADISLATHWYNRANYNPATITRTDYMYLFSNYRQQWEGIDGAPRVFNIQASEYVHKYHSAIGFSLVSDKLGVTRTFNPMVSYAYRTSDKQDWWVSMGMAAGLFSRTVDGSTFDAEDASDASLFSNTERFLKPDVNFGLEFQNQHFVIGTSSTHLLSVFNHSDITAYTNHRYAYLVYKSNKPQLYNYSTGIQMVNRYNLTFLDFNVCFRFKQPTGLLKGARELFDLGLTYRTTKQLIALVGVNITSDIRAGYAYEQTFKTGMGLNGTHEIMVEYRIPSKTASTKYKCGNNLFWYH